MDQGRFIAVIAIKITGQQGHPEDIKPI